MNVLIDLLNFLVYQMQWKPLWVENKNRETKNDQQELKHLNSLHDGYHSLSMIYFVVDNLF